MEDQHQHFQHQRLPSQGTMALSPWCLARWWFERRYISRWDMFSRFLEGTSLKMLDADIFCRMRMSPRSSMESVTSEISKVQSQASQVSSQEVRVAWVEQIVKHRRDFQCRTRKKTHGGGFFTGKLPSWTDTDYRVFKKQKVTNIEKPSLWLVVSISFNVQPYLGKWSNLTIVYLNG